MYTPSIVVAPGSAGSGSAGIAAPGQVAISLQNLISEAADIVPGSGTKTIILSTGLIGMASPFQVGNTETLQEQQANLQALASLAAECRANGVSVIIDTVLTNPATFSDGSNALTNYWAPVAAQVGLPIVGVEDVNEMGLNVSGSALTNCASVEANAVKTLIDAYTHSSYNLTAANLKVGDMDAGYASNEAAWINAYDAAATALGVPEMSFISDDMGLFEPWMGSSTDWAASLESFSNLAITKGLALNPIVQGEYTDLSAGQFVMQAEQMAIYTAKLQSTGSVNISSLVVTSWRAEPIGVDEVSSPTSTANEAAEINAFYPLYESHLITAQGAVITSAPGQILLNTGSVTPINPLIINWGSVDVQNGLRLGVVLIDQTGTLTATQHGTGTVFKPAGNILVLSGNASDLAAELSSVELQESYAGPDTLDVETYGDYGRIADNQVAVYAATGQTVGSLNATSSAQGWSASSAVLNTGTVIGSGSLVTTETLYWGTTITSSGTVDTAHSGFLRVDSIHEPLAEYGVEFASGTLLGTSHGAVADVFDPSVDNGSYETTGYANNRGVNNLQIGTPLVGGYHFAFVPMAALTAIPAISTVRTFNASTGQLETSIDTLAPDPVTVTDLTGAHVDMFVTAFDQGGTVVTVLNTANNPLWQAGWADQFDSATLTYDGSGRLVEEFLQGGPSNPLFAIDNVFDPSDGALWEQFQSSAQPPKASSSDTYVGTGNPYQPNFVTGPVYVLQIDTGDNPNWDYVDWGTIPTDTSMWTDYFATGNIGGMVVNALAGQSNGIGTYPLQFVNGPTLDLIGLPGSVAVNLNALGSVTIQSQTMVSSLSGLDAVDAWGATGQVSLTGLARGGSTLTGGDYYSTIVGFGNDTIVAGAGVTTISTGAGHSNVFVTSSNGATTLTGGNNTITAAPGSSITIHGTNNIVVATGTGAGVTLNISAGDVIQLTETLAWSTYGTSTPFAYVSVGDANIGQTETVTVALSAATNGTLGNLGAGMYNAATGVYADTGSAAAVTADLNALVFTPTAHEVAPPQTVTTTFTISDIDTGSAGAIESKTSVIATAAGTPPPGEVILHGAATQYVIADDSGSLYIQDTVAGRDGTQILSDVKEMEFTNGVGLVDPTGTAEDVARLYQGLLDRAPDAAGLKAWTALVDDSNVPLSVVANAFASSPEFIQKCGSLSDTAFIDQLYENALGRPAEATGVQAWDSSLTSGISRGQVAVDIAESTEAQASSLSTAGDNNNAEVYRLYETALGRAPDPAGGAYWSSVLANGASVTQVAQNFIGSGEFHQDYGALSPTEFVTLLYQNALHRAPDAAGFRNWVSALQGGASEASMMVGFSDSTESRVLTAGATHANWVFVSS
jgi:hypothetical protein